MSDTRTSPLRELVAGASAEVRALLSHPTDLVKLGVKGPGVAAWARAHAIPLPAARYAVLPVGGAGVLARVGEGELILECLPEEPLWERWRAALAGRTDGVYVIEQQSATVELTGPLAPSVLARSCAVELAQEPLERILYTRVGGVSCAVLPRTTEQGRGYRLWVDYSIAPYLWNTLAAFRIDV